TITQTVDEKVVDTRVERDNVHSDFVKAQEEIRRIDRRINEINNEIEASGKKDKALKDEEEKLKAQLKELEAKEGELIGRKTKLNEDKKRDTDSNKSILEKVDPTVLGKIQEAAKNEAEVRVQYEKTKKEVETLTKEAADEFARLTLAWSVRKRYEPTQMR